MKIIKTHSTRKPRPEPPHWYWFGECQCFCKHHNCGNCKHLKQWRRGKQKRIGSIKAKEF